MAEAFVRTIKRDYARVSSRPNAESGIRPRKAHVAQLNQLARTVPVIRGEPVARVIESAVFVLRRFGTEKRIKEMYSPMDDGTVAGRKAVMGALRLYLDSSTYS